MAWKQKIQFFQTKIIDFSRFGDRFLEAKSTKKQLKNGIQDSIPKLKPLWTRNRAQDTSKTLPRRPYDASRRPKTPQDAPKTAPGRLQDDPKTPFRRPKILPRRPQDGSKVPKTPPKCFQDAPRRPWPPPRRLQTSILVPPGLNFRMFLHVKLLIFGSFANHFYMRIFTSLHVMSYQKM